MSESKAMDIIVANLARIAGCMSDDRIELTQAVNMYSDLIYEGGPRGPTGGYVVASTLRSAREMHAKITRSLRKVNGFTAEVAAKMSLCAWFEAWRRSKVCEQCHEGQRLRFTLSGLQIIEEHEEPRTTTPLSMMEFVTLDNLRSHKNLTEFEKFHDLQHDLGVMLELQVILEKHSDGEVRII